MSVVTSVDGPIAAREPSIRRIIAVGEGLVQGLCDDRLGPVHARLKVDIALEIRVPSLATLIHASEPALTISQTGAVSAGRMRSEFSKGSSRDVGDC